VDNQLAARSVTQGDPLAFALAPCYVRGVKQPRAASGRYSSCIMDGSRSTSLFILALCAIAFAVCAISPGSARADGTVRVVVVPYSTHEGTTAELRIADRIEAALLSASVPVISMHDARDRVLATSRAPISVERSELNALQRDAREAVENAAYGRSAATQRSVSRLIERAERALESVNRETKTARSVLDACLALVRDALTRHERNTGLSEAMRCRRLVPDVAASDSLHPAAVIGVLAEADNQLRRMREGRLVVESAPKSGCSVYVNGRHLGVTPFRMERAVKGEYRVQVECVRSPGRVHFVNLEDEPALLRVDTDFDRALWSDERLRLVYERPPNTHIAVDHAAQLTRVVEAEEAVLFRLEDDRLQLMRVGLQAQVLAHVSMIVRANAADDTAQDAELTDALDRLFEGDFEEDLTGAVPSASKNVLGRAPASSSQSPASDPVELTQRRGEERNESTAVGSGAETAASSRPAVTKQQTRAVRPASLALLGITAGLGVASLVASGVLSHKRHARGESAVDAFPGTPLYSDAVDGWNARRTAPYLLAAAGGALLAVGAIGAVVLGKHAPPRWVSALSGAVALGLLSWGIADVVGGGPCEPQLDLGSCVAKRERRDRGGVIAVSALPFLVLPVAAEVRRAKDRRVVHGSTLALQPSVEPDAVELRLRFSARF
jgi:hypothetical protein